MPPAAKVAWKGPLPKVKFVMGQKRGSSERFECVSDRRRASSSLLGTPVDDGWS
jgi:hypothetical protein